jgi:hypothetical protein
LTQRSAISIPIGIEAGASSRAGIHNWDAIFHIDDGFGGACVRPVPKPVCARRLGIAAGVSVSVADARQGPVRACSARAAVTTASGENAPGHSD